MLNFLKSLRKYFIFILPIVFIIPGCGGGGGGDGGGGTPAPTVPTVINYAVGPSSMTPLLTGTAASGSFSVTHLDLAGSYNRSTAATTLLENRGMALNINVTPAALGGGAMTIGITTPAGSTAQWVSGSNPTAGKFLVTVTARDQITVQVNSGGTGVDIYVLGALVASMPWADFVSAVENSPVPNVVLASLAYNAIQTVYRCVSQAYTMIEVVMENQDTLTQGMINVALVTSLPGYPSNLSAQWGDANGNGSIDPGDNFLSRFSNWWVDNPGTNQDYFYHGRMLWLNYWEGTNSSGTFVGGDFKIGITGDEFFEEEVNSGAPDLGTRITYKESGFLFLLSW